MAELRVVDGRLRIGLEGRSDAGLEFEGIATILEPDGARHRVPIERSMPAGERLSLAGAAADFEASAEWRPAADTTDHFELRLTVRHRGARPRRAGLRVEAVALGEGRPDWLVPGIFYGENRLPGNRRAFPRWDPAGGTPQALVSDGWSFRADRCAVPAVLCRGERATVGLWTHEVGGLGEQGVGFRGDGRTSSIWIDAPFREEPVAYAQAEEASPAAVSYHEWQPGEVVSLRIGVFVTPPAPHAYDGLLRHAYAALRETSPLRPWMGPREAAELTAEGLLRWHFKPEHGVLYETAAFDREAIGEQGDRPHMHVAWVSGAPWAAALLEHGRRTGRAEQASAGAAVLDTISGGLAPCGAFWGEWRADGWRAGWNPGGQLHARTLSEATLFMARAARAESERGTDRPAWRSAVTSNLDFVVARQRRDGNLGAYYDPHSGEVSGWDGAAGLGWVAALIEGAYMVGRSEWLSVAERAGAYYARFVEDELIYGAPEDVHLTPTSEDGYAAVIAYVHLHAATAERRWLDLARRAADWTMSFRYAYNVSFPAGTPLAVYDFRTRGGDQASPSNQHLHAYGLICLPEMVALWRATGDPYYLVRTRDNLACFLQFIARRDGHFNAYRGMVSERYYQTAWGQAKGMLLGLSHAWSVGVVLHACLAALDDPAAFPPDWPALPGVGG